MNNANFSIHYITLPGVEVLNFEVQSLLLKQLNVSIMRTAGLVLLIIGLIGTLVFGIQAIQDTETFSFLGIDIGVSSANWTPLILSAVIMVVGIVLMNLNKKAFAK